MVTHEKEEPFLFEMKPLFISLILSFVKPDLIIPVKIGNKVLCSFALNPIWVQWDTLSLLSRNNVFVIHNPNHYSKH